MIIEKYPLSFNEKPNKHVMKQLKWMLLALLIPFTLQAQTTKFSTKNGQISFFSSTPVEDIDAHSDQAAGGIDITTKGVAFQVKMTTFTFKKALMQEHFNENYVESDKFPYATFKGKIDDNVDLTKEGTYNVTVTGDFTVHGVTKQRSIPGTIVVKSDGIEITSAFDVKVEDHDIEVPTIVVKNIAEVIQVKMNAMLTPYTKS